MFTRLKNLDDRIFDNIPRIHKPAVNKIMLTASRLGNAGIIWWFVCLAFLIIPKWRYTGLVIIFHQPKPLPFAVLTFRRRRRHQ